MEPYFRVMPPRPGAAFGYCVWPHWDGWEPVPVRMRDQGGALSQRGIFRESVPPNHDAGSGPQPYQESMMRFYSTQHRFYGGIDLHARTMHVCVLDHDGQVVCDQNLACRPETFLRAVAPFREGLVVGVECMFAWYWLADLCHEQQVDFVLGHALYMKAIHGGKAKNDRIDARKMRRLL